MRSFLSNLGKVSVLIPVLFVNPPGVLSVSAYVNSKSLVTVMLSKSPLYPLLNVPIPVQITSSVTFLIKTLSPVVRLCGSSVLTLTTSLLYEHVLINLGFLLYS